MTSSKGSESFLNSSSSCCSTNVILRTFRIATRLDILLLATVAMVAIAAGWRLSSNLIPPDTLKDRPSLAADVEQFSTWPWSRKPRAESWYVQPPIHSLWTVVGQPPEDLVHAIPPRLGIPLTRLAASQTSGWVTLYYLLGFVWTLVCSSFFGVGIARMAAMQFTRDDRLGFSEAIAFAQKRYGAHLAAIGLAVMFAFVCTTPMLLLSLFLRGGPIGIALAGIFWWVSMFCIAFAALALVLAAIGYPLFWGAVAADGSDAFDTVSRSLAYLKQRPLEYLGYTLLALVLGTLGWLGVTIVSESAIQIGRWTASCAGGTENVDTVDQILKGAATDSRLTWFGAQLIGLCDKAIRAIAAGYSFSFLVCGFVGVYLLLRHSVDDVELDEIERPHRPVATLPINEARHPMDDKPNIAIPSIHDDQAHP